MSKDVRNQNQIELLEARNLFSGGSGKTFVYVETNSADANAILVYERNPSNGSLKEARHAAFFTGGKGFRNKGSLLGPDDSDREVVASEDGKLLFAVNQGSNTISVFEIKTNGDLKLQGVYPSGGTQPVSVALDGDRLFVANRGDEGGTQQGKIGSSFKSFYVLEDGTLSPIPNSTIKLKVGSSAAQVLATGDGKLFANTFTAPMPTSDNNKVIPYKIGSDGRLTLASGGALGAPGLAKGAVLGLINHPTKRIIYAGLPADGQVGVYSYDTSGKLHFKGGFGAGEAAACWLVTSADGKYLYVADSLINTVAVFSLADPYKPKEIQKFALKGPTKPDGDKTPGVKTFNFQFALDPTGKSLYVVNHAILDNFQKGNVLHALTVKSDGKVYESNKPLYFPSDLAPASAHPQGIAVVGNPGGTVNRTAVLSVSPFSRQKVTGSSTPLNDVLLGSSTLSLL